MFQLDKRLLEEIPETTRDDNYKKTRLAPASAKQDDVEFVKKIISRERLVRTKVNILRGTKVWKELLIYVSLEEWLYIINFTIRKFFINFQAFHNLIKLGDDLVLKKSQPVSSKGKEKSANTGNRGYYSICETLLSHLILMLFQPFAATIPNSSIVQKSNTQIAGRQQPSSGVRTSKPLSRGNLQGHQ